jgi:alpha-amylase
VHYVADCMRLSLAQTAVIFTLAYPYGYPQVMSSYLYERHGDGAPRQPVHGPDGRLNCGMDGPWVCQHRWQEIANMVSCCSLSPPLHSH